ncbi:MAG TPA: DMT family transporter [Candidatus Limnocylindrales bacterium]|nr:DMT family transporter [Candidatus Limnocylindrales bacterium]
MPRTLTAGVMLAFVTASVSGVSIMVNAVGVRQVPDAAVYTTAKNLVAALVLVGLLGLGGGIGRLRSLDRRSAGWLFAIAIVGGSVPFVLFFSGLAVASAPSAAFIHKTMFVWVALLAVPLLGERLGPIQLAALGVLLAGQFLLTPPTGVRWGSGEMMIAAATLLWSIEIVVARRLLRTVDAATVGAARMGIGVVVLLGYLLVTGRIGGLLALGAAQWSWVVATGLLLAAYVTTWFAALQRAPATIVSAVLVSGAVVTGGLTALQQGGLPGSSVSGNALILLAALAIGARAVVQARSRSLVPEPADARAGA